MYDDLRELRHDKWGWVFYRCTYADEDGWARFKQIIDERSRERIAESDTPELANSLEWTFVENRAELNGASTDQLRARFKEWASEAIKTEHPRATPVPGGTLCIPRYNYFIQVDEDVLRSVVYEPEEDMWEKGYVKLVQASWRSLIEALEEYKDEDLHEPIDGCPEEDVGWMKISTPSVGVSLYDALWGFPHIWYAFYLRPPDTVDY